MLTSKILLDASPLCEEQLTGIGTYAKNLIQHLHQMNSFNINLGLPLSRISKRSRVQKKIGYKVQLENNFTNIFGNNYDVVHGLDFNFKIKMSSNTKKVITVHDMAAFEHNLLENHFAFMARSKLYSTIANEKTDLVLCVSEFTKNRFLHFFPHYGFNSRRDQKIEFLHLEQNRPIDQPCLQSCHRAEWT